MRLPVTPQISTKDGLSNKNARLTNCLKESKKGGDKAVVRPGLVLEDTYSGIGNGLIPFDGRLLVIYDDTVYDTEEDLTLPFPLDALPWDASTTYYYGDVIWCNGVLKFSNANGNIGNACDAAGTTYWVTSRSTDTYDEAGTYAIGDSVSVSGVTYYSMAPSNTGNDPASTPMWSTSAPTSSRYRGYIPVAGMGAGNPGDECASRESAAYSAYAQSTAAYSCATKFAPSWLWRTYIGVTYVPGHPSGYEYRIYLRMWTDASPGDCSGVPVDTGIDDNGTVRQTV